MSSIIGRFETYKKENGLYEPDVRTGGKNRNLSDQDAIDLILSIVNGEIDGVGLVKFFRQELGFKSSGGSYYTVLGNRMLSLSKKGYLKVMRGKSLPSEEV